MPPSSTAIIRSRRETCIYRFRSNSVQRHDILLSRNPHPFLHPFPTNRSRNDDRADCGSYTLRLRPNVYRRVYAKSYVFAFIVYVYVHARGRI